MDILTQKQPILRNSPWTRGLVPIEASHRRRRDVHRALIRRWFDGLRHDSGDPVVWGEKALAHYARLKVNAHSKRLVFSDGLDLPAALSLYGRFADRIQTGFGIGTNLTNDVGLTPLNIVMKLVSCNGQPVAKLSDSPGKTICDDETFLAYLRQVFRIED